MAFEPFFSTRAQRAFMSTITIQAIVVLAMIGIVFRLVENEVSLTMTRYKTLPCYLTLFALAEIFELLMAADALWQRNIVQLIGILCFHVALLISAALQVHETKIALVILPDCDGTVSFIQCGGPHTLWHRILPYLIVAPCVIGASWLVMLFCIKQLYAEFGWAIFHVVGANPKMKTMYQWYQIMICFLKFDFFFFTGVTIQLLILVLAKNSAEFGVTVAAIPVVLLLLVLCGIAVQREIKSIMTISLIMMLAAEGYLYKLTRFYQPVSSAQYISTRATLTTFTIAAFLLLFATFLVGLRCFTDFDKGLITSKVHSVPVQYSSSGNSEKVGRKGSRQDGIPMAPRISIE